MFQPTQTFHVVTQQYADVEAEQNQVQGLALTYAKCLQALIQVLACVCRARAGACIRLVEGGEGQGKGAGPGADAC